MSWSPCDLLDIVHGMLQDAGIDLSDETRDYNELIAEGLGEVKMVRGRRIRRKFERHSS